MLGRGLVDGPRTGDSGERVALTPSLSLPFVGGSRFPLVLVLWDDCVSELGSAWSLGPWSWDEESSTRIFRTLIASLPNEKKEKKY